MTIYTEGVVKFIKASVFPLLNAIQETEQQIEELKQKVTKYYQELDALIRQNLLDYKWKPYYNEKAVYIMLKEKTAWHVWFLEEDTGSFRFREVPNEFTEIYHYYRQPIMPPKTASEKHEWIVPMWLFQEINSLIKLYLEADKRLNK